MGTDLQRLIDATQMKGITIWKEYPDVPGFEVEVAFLGKQEMIRIYDDCTERIWDREERKARRELSRQKVAQIWAERVIKNWRGLTVGNVQKFYPIKKVGNIKDSTVIEPTQENKVALLWNSADFENWILAVATSPEHFVEAREEAEKEMNALEKP